MFKIWSGEAYIRGEVSIFIYRQVEYVVCVKYIVYGIAIYKTVLKIFHI